MSASSSMIRTRPLLGGVEVLGVRRSGIHWLSAQRELQMKQCTSAGLTLHFDRSAVLADDAVSDRQAQTGSLSGDFGGEEGIVDTGQVFGGNSLPGIRDFDARRIVRSSVVIDHESAAAFHGVPGVQEQIEKHLLEFAGIAFDGTGGRCPRFSVHLRRWRVRSCGPTSETVSRDNAIQVDIVKFGRRSAREVQQRIDDFAGAECLLGDLFEKLRFLVVAGDLLGQHSGRRWKLRRAACSLRERRRQPATRWN